MKLDTHHPENKAILTYLAEGKDASVPAIASPSSVPDAYMGCGAHPDIVERVWDQLGAGLSKSCRCLVYGTPALVHDKTGVVLALALGTLYALRIPEARITEADTKGMKTVHVFKTAGVTLDLATFGSAWRFGEWSKIEVEWTAALYTALLMS